MTFIWILLGLLVAAFIWWRFLYVSRPKLPPLQVDPNDPLWVEAVGKAQRSIPRFRDLAGKPKTQARVKVPFLSSAGVTEHLWAEVLSFQDAMMHVRYLTPPVTHTGLLERLHYHQVSDLTDWLVEMPTGRIAGGFTMRVTFARGREQWGSLPPDLEAEEKKYETELG